MAKTPTIPRKAQQVNLQIDKGSTFRGGFIWKIENPPGSGIMEPKNLTGWSGRAQFRPDVDSPTLYYEMTTENGGIIIDGPNGTVVMFIPDADSSAFDWNEAVYGLELQDDTGATTPPDVRRLTYGDVEAFDETTRPETP